MSSKSACPDPVLEAGITVEYRGGHRALSDCRIELRPGEAVGLIGESGAGKSTLALALLGLLGYRRARVEGFLRIDGQDVIRASEGDWRRLRGRKIALVPQSPIASLTPTMRVQEFFEEAWGAHAGNRRSSELRVRMVDLLERVALPVGGEFLRKRPAQLSVGQAQRLLIALALLHRPALLVADEPTSALDIVSKSKVLILLRELAREHSAGLLHISHDLPAVAGSCDQVAVLHEGHIVEQGPVDQVFSQPSHIYTQTLVNAVPEWKRPSMCETSS